MHQRELEHYVIKTLAGTWPVNPCSCHSLSVVTPHTEGLLLVDFSASALWQNYPTFQGCGDFCVLRWDGHNKNVSRFWKKKKSLICSRVGHSGVCIWTSVIDWEVLHALVHSSDVWARPEPGTRSFFRSLEGDDSDLAFLLRSGNPGFISGMATVGISVSPSHLPPPPSWYFRKESCIYYWDFS